MVNICLGNDADSLIFRISKWYGNIRGWENIKINAKVSTNASYINDNKYTNIRFLQNLQGDKGPGSSELNQPLLPSKEKINLALTFKRKSQKFLFICIKLVDLLTFFFVFYLQNHYLGTHLMTTNLFFIA